jgi:transcriptional regulator with XRE-family HTH domain
MEATISSLADTSSILEGGRAKISDSADIPVMKKETWRDRLSKAVSDSGKSMRAVSLAAGLGPGYVHSILKDEKDPTIENLIAVANATGVSLSYLLYGFEVSPETEEVLQLLESRPGQRSAILQLLRAKENF